jgi:hypothetical protein
MNPEEQKDFMERAREYAGYYERDERYPVTIGQKCKTCEFKNTGNREKKSGYEECWYTRLGEDFDPGEPHVFEIWNLRNNERLVDAGIYYMRDLLRTPGRYTGGSGTWWICWIWLNGTTTIP